ncbi:sucrase-like protein [Trifolium pratense]|uniref:Sucrase-like protein n=1 Tax=Trifolium pratense TaxID=57577 RepID=A0A2K3MHS2_TRIPR|nr:sucrase-like protein [Trifolium pratense]
MGLLGSSHRLTSRFCKVDLGPIQILIWYQKAYSTSIGPPAIRFTAIGHSGHAPYVQSWLGQMGLSEEEQIIKQEQRLLLNGIGILDESFALNESSDNFTSCCQSNGVSCCQENGDSSFCQSQVSVDNRMSSDAIETEAKLSADNKSSKPVISRTNSGKGASRKFHSMTTWLDGWEQEDTYAALAVACAAVSVTIAYNCYKQLT